MSSTSFRSRHILAWLLVCLVATAAVTRVRAHQTYSNVTWANDIGPILERHCVDCHRSGGYGPMPLESFAQAKQWMHAIKEQVLDGEMPPWPAAGGFGQFEN